MLCPEHSSMEAILLGVAIGAGAVLVLKRSKLAVRGALGWTARTAGKLTGQVAQAIDASKRHVRDEYARGREANLERMNEIPPTSTRPNGKSIPPTPPAN
jgi:hypothetical protein